MVAEFKRRRDVLVAGLNRLPGVTCRSPRGAFYVFPNIKALKRPSTEVAETLLQEAGVAVLGGSAFGEYGEGYLRLSYASAEANLRKALDADASRCWRGSPARSRSARCPPSRELIVEGLLRAEVARIFGVPGGGSNLEVIEAARARGLPFVLCHQEWAATIMAAVTGELTGRPGAVALDARARRHRERHRPGPRAARPLAAALHQRSPPGGRARLRHASVSRSRRAPRAHREGQRDGDGRTRRATGSPTRYSSRSRSRAGPSTWTCPRTWPARRRCRWPPR